MMLVPTYVAPSPIHGAGLFTSEPIAKGTLIWEFIEGLDVEIPEKFLQHENESVRVYLDRYTYPHPHRAGFVVLDGDNGRFMNHSEEPNSDFRTPNVGYALVDIPADTELLCNYHEFAPGFTFV